MANMKFYKNSSGGNALGTCGRKDRRTWRGS